MGATESYQIYYDGWTAMKYPRADARELAARCTASDIWHASEKNADDCTTKDCPCERGWRNYLPGR